MPDHEYFAIMTIIYRPKAPNVRYPLTKSSPAVGQLVSSTRLSANNPAIPGQSDFTRMVRLLQCWATVSANRSRSAWHVLAGILFLDKAVDFPGNKRIHILSIIKSSFLLMQQRFIQ